MLRAASLECLSARGDLVIRITGRSKRWLECCFACMSEVTYTLTVTSKDKPLAWLHGEIKTPPFGKEARLEVFAKKTRQTCAAIIATCRKRAEGVRQCG